MERNIYTQIYETAVGKAHKYEMQYDEDENYEMIEEKEESDYVIKIIEGQFIIEVE